MLKERYSLIKSATVDNQGKIADEIGLFSSFNLATALLRLKKFDQDHCVVVERHDGFEWLYVEDSEMYND